MNIKIYEINGFRICRNCGKHYKNFLHHLITRRCFNARFDSDDIVINCIWILLFITILSSIFLRWYLGLFGLFSILFIWLVVWAEDSERKEKQC